MKRVIHIFYKIERLNSTSETGLGAQKVNILDYK